MDISICNTIKPKPVTPQTQQSYKQLFELHRLRLDKLLRETGDAWMPDSTLITQYSEEFSTLPALVQRTVLANSTQIVPAIEDGLMRADAVAGFKALLNTMPVDDQNLIVMCLWHTEHTEHTSTLRNGLVQLLPVGARDAMAAELGEPLLDEIPKKKLADTSPAKTDTDTEPTTIGIQGVEKFAFYQTGDVDQTFVKFSGMSLDEMVSTGNASAIRKYRNSNFRHLGPAEKRIVLAECPGLISAIEADDTDTLQAYRQLLSTQSPDDQETVIRRLWQNSTTKNIGIYQGLADLLPLDQKEKMLADLAQIVEQCKKQSADPLTKTATADQGSSAAELGLQLKKALGDRDAAAIKAMGTVFEKLCEADQIRILKDASKPLNDILGIRTGFFPTKLTQPAVEIVEAYKYLLRLIKRPTAQVHVVVDLIALYSADTRSEVHAAYSDKRMDIAALMPVTVSRLTSELLSYEAQHGYTGLFATVHMGVYNWIKLFIVSVKAGNADEVQLSEKLYELIPWRNRYDFLFATFLKREHGMCSGTGDAAVQIRAFVRLFKSVAPIDRSRIGIYFSGGVKNALKNKNSDVLRAFGEMIDYVPKNQRDNLNFWLLEGDKPELLRFFPVATLETQQALLEIALRMFNEESNYKTVNLYLDLVATIKDQDERSALITPQAKTLKKQLDAATLSLHYKVRLHFTDRLQAILSAK